MNRTPEELARIQNIGIRADELWQKALQVRGFGNGGSDDGCEQYVWIGPGEVPAEITRANEAGFLCAGDYVSIIATAKQVADFPFLINTLAAFGDQAGVEANVKKLVQLIDSLCVLTELESDCE